jgi:hypothetical protein
LLRSESCDEEPFFELAAEGAARRAVALAR